MLATIHIPGELLMRAEKRAEALAISRDTLIVRALKRELAQGDDWSPGFFETLRAIDRQTAKTVDELMAAIRATRGSKPPHWATSRFED